MSHDGPQLRDWNPCRARSGEISFLFVWSISLWDKLPRAIILAQRYMDNSPIYGRVCSQSILNTQRSAKWSEVPPPGPNSKLRLWVLLCETRHEQIFYPFQTSDNRHKWLKIDGLCIFFTCFLHVLQFRSPFLPRFNATIAWLILRSN